MRTQLNGYVVGDEDLWLYDWFEIPAFSPQRVRGVLEQCPEEEELILEINSGGGSVFAGFEMYSVLQSSGADTVAEVQSLAASAASVVMLGCREVRASPVAQVMIHLPTVQTEGDRSVHQTSIGVLDSITESILNAYTVKCGARSTRDELRQLMKTSTWMTAPEAKGLGLVDKIVGEETIDSAAILNCAGGMPHGIRAMAAAPMPSPGSLRREYDRLTAEGKVPARGQALENPPSGDESKLAKARLELERIRFWTKEEPHETHN